MKLYEPFTFIIITVLIFAFSGTLFHDMIGRAKLSCKEKTVELLKDNREGPLEECNKI